MDKVQYVGPVEALRGQTALMQPMQRQLLRSVIESDDPYKIVAAVQWDWPEGQKFTPMGSPIDAPNECFGWHEVDGSHWLLCHTISEFAAI